MMVLGTHGLRMICLLQIQISESVSVTFTSICMINTQKLLYCRILYNESNALPVEELLEKIVFVSPPIDDCFFSSSSMASREQGRARED